MVKLFIHTYKCISLLYSINIALNKPPLPLYPHRLLKLMLNTSNKYKYEVIEEQLDTSTVINPPSPCPLMPNTPSHIVYWARLKWEI